MTDNKTLTTLFPSKTRVPICDGNANTTETDKGICAAENSNDTLTALKDSGTRRQFVTGAVRDMSEGKGRMDLLPWSAIIEVSKHCEKGAVKYGEHNAEQGIPLHSYIDSAFRHLAKFTDGQKDEPHLVAACWNLLFALETINKNPDMVDIPFREHLEKYR